MRLTDTKQARYSMLLICEGTHTEPNFLELMIEDFKEAGIIDFATTIKPKPTISPSDNTLDLNRGKEKRRKRLLKNTTQKQQEIENMDFFPGEQPLNWVKGDIDNLKVYDLSLIHISNFIKEPGVEACHPKFPFLTLLVSGGNSQIIIVQDYLDMEVIGQTIDDAAGEAYDKCSKVMGLSYPGGPVIDRLAKDCLLYTSRCV